VSLLLLTPAPFVDASAASAFRHASQRLAVSAAGISPSWRSPGRR
jgi:hypothetical protein